MSSQQDFWELDEETRVVELKLQEYFRNRGYTVIDKRDDEECRQKDIDFEIHMLNSQSLNIEVKADKKMYKTGNILIELSHKRPVKGKTNGWFKYCEADIICYHDNVNNKGYMLKWQKMKSNLLGNFRLISFDNPHDIGTRTFAFLVPLDKARDFGFIAEEYKL